MSKETNSKKLLLGSALAGLMVAAPGLSVTTGKFFQTANLKVGYGLAQAKEAPAPAPAPTSGSQVDDTTTQGDPSTRGKHMMMEPESQPTTPQAEKKGDKSCGAGSCGGH